VSYLQSISRNTIDNLGGIFSIKVARKADIVSIPAPVAGVVYGDIEFQEGAGFVTWDVTHESASAGSEGKVSREGFSKNNKLPFRIPRGRASLKIMFDQAVEDELIVLYTENGKTKIFGLLEAPVKFSYSHKSGEAIADLNRYEGLFYYEGPDNMYEYDGEIELAPGGVVPALVKYNGDVIASLLPGETLNIISDFGFTDFYITSS
jgi:hypothetical protein